jgi:hypothetical protein
MIKTFHLKVLSPSEVLDQVHRSGVIDYMYNWGYSINEKRKSITFNIRYTGGSDDDLDKIMMDNLEEFLNSIDSE